MIAGCVSFASVDSTVAVNGLQSYLAPAQSWMSMNKLKLNSDKTEFLLIRNENNRANMTCNCSCVQSSRLLQFTSVRYHGHRPHLTSAYSELTGLHCNKVSSICSQPSTVSFPSLVASKVENIVQDQFCLSTKHFMKNSLLVFTLCLPYHSHPIHWYQNKGNNLSVPRVKTNTCTGARALQSCDLSLWNNLPLFVCSAISVATLEKHFKKHHFDFAFPHRHRHAQWPVDVTELFLWFCCLTPIQLSCRWAWFHQGYWHYRNFTDWLKIICLCPILVSFPRVLRKFRLAA